MQIYHLDNKGKYISKDDCGLVQMLAQKKYNQRVVALAEKRKSQIEKILEDYQDMEIETLLLKEHPIRQKLITPAELPWEQRQALWYQESYEERDLRMAHL